MLSLDGVRILAVEQYGAGPFGTQFLADAGAEVIKIEAPATPGNPGGDYARALGPHFFENGESQFFHSFNRNKKSLTLDLKKPEGQAVFRDLVKTADAVASNSRGDVAERLGITYDQLKDVNEKIVCAHLSAYGRTGSRASWPGFDFLMQAEAGHFSVTGEPGSPPTRLGLSGIPREAELLPLERDLRLAALTGANYHAAKISTAMSAEAIRAAKDKGLSVSAGVSINHLSLNENDIGEYRTFFKLSPPLRHEDDRLAMVEALKDGTIDVIVSSHDPQDVDTKRLPFSESADGAVGLETLLSAGLRLVHNGDLSLSRLIEAMSTAPAKLLGIEAGTLAPGAPADFAVIDLEFPWVLDAEALHSESKNTAFDEARFSGRVMQTVVAGNPVYGA